MPISELTSVAASVASFCGLNGGFINGACVCDSGWHGPSCSELHLAPASPIAYGLQDTLPTWGGGATFADGHWHLIVGSLAQDLGNNSLHFYPCNSKIVHAVSANDDPAGPYIVNEVLVPRVSWEPMLTVAPNGSLVLMFFGNISSPPDLNSSECVGGDVSLLTHGTHIMVSHSGSPDGPWTVPQLVRGMEAALDGSVLVAGHGRLPRDPCSWRCANGNPGPAFHPNGTLYATMRSNTCLKGCSKGEHISLWRADQGWDDEWTLVSDQPIGGWGDVTEETCHGSGDACLQLEDPYLWIDERGWHLLAHYQNNHKIRDTRGGYAWSLDGLSWTLETLPRNGTASAWDSSISWTNGSSRTLARRQRVSIIRDPRSGRPTHLVNGADFLNSSQHGDPPAPWCEGCHWGTGLTLIQPLHAQQLESVV